MYSTGFAYLLWLLSGFGVAGFHRFYLGKIPSGILWMLSGGLFGFGALYDLITLPAQVREANFRNALIDREAPDTGHRGQARPDHVRYADNAQYRIVPSGAARGKATIEHIILKIAKENKGVLTVSDVALGAGIPIEEAKKCLEALVSKGFAELRVRKSGSLVYVIPDMADSDEPLEDF